MTFAIRLGINSQAGYGFYVKLTPMVSRRDAEEEFERWNFCLLMGNNTMIYLVTSEQI